MDPEKNGGEAGIRTLGRVTPSIDFESIPFGHSGTSPSDSVTKATGFFDCLKISALVLRAMESRLTSGIPGIGLVSVCRNATGIFQHARQV